MTDSPSTVSRAVRVVLAVTLLGAVTGCLGAGPGASATPTATPSPTPSVGTDCPPSLTVYEIDREPIDPDTAVAYDNLTAEQRETFHRAMNTSVEDFDYAWNDIDLVERNGTYYRAGILVC
jgi:hypothetical protein